MTAMKHEAAAFDAALSTYAIPAPRSSQYFRGEAWRHPQADSLISLDAEPVEGECADVRKLLSAARDIHDQLSAKNPLSAVAASTDNISAFAIGQLLHNAFRKDLIVPNMTASQVLDAVFAYDTTVRPGTILSRPRFIAAMKVLGIVSPDRRDRDLKPAGTTPCLRAVATLIEEFTNIKLADLSSPSRAKPTVRARFKAIWVMRTVCGHSLSMIGEQMGKRDHTTILNSINKVALEIETDHSYRKAMEILCEKADFIGVMQSRSILLRQLPN